MAKKQRKRERVYGQGGVKKEQKADAKSSGGDSFWEGVKSLGLALVLFLVLRSFVIQNFVITSGSMEETLLVGDFLMVNRVALGVGFPSRPRVSRVIPSLAGSTSSSSNPRTSRTSNS